MLNMNIISQSNVVAIYTPTNSLISLHSFHIQSGRLLSMRNLPYLVRKVAVNEKWNEKAKFIFTPFSWHQMHWKLMKTLRANSCLEGTRLVLSKRKCKIWRGYMTVIVSALTAPALVGNGTRVVRSGGGGNTWEGECWPQVGVQSNRVDMAAKQGPGSLLNQSTKRQIVKLK